MACHKKNEPRNLQKYVRCFLFYIFPGFYWQFKNWYVWVLLFARYFAAFSNIALSLSNAEHFFGHLKNTLRPIAKLVYIIYCSANALPPAHVAFCAAPGEVSCAAPLGVSCVAPHRASCAPREVFCDAPVEFPQVAQKWPMHVHAMNQWKWSKLGSGIISQRGFVLCSCQERILAAKKAPFPIRKSEDIFFHRWKWRFVPEPLRTTKKKQTNKQTNEQTNKQTN